MLVILVPTQMSTCQSFLRSCDQNSLGDVMSWQQLSIEMYLNLSCSLRFDLSLRIGGVDSSKPISF